MLTKARLKRAPLKFAAYRIAAELGMSELEVLKWTPSRIKGWLTYFALSNDLEREAIKKAQRKQGK